MGRVFYKNAFAIFWVYVSIFSHINFNVRSQLTGKVQSFHNRTGKSSTQNSTGNIISVQNNKTNYNYSKDPKNSLLDKNSTKSDRELEKEISEIIEKRVTTEDNGTLIVTTTDEVNKTKDNDDRSIFDDTATLFGHGTEYKRWKIKFELFTLKNPKEGQSITFSTKVSETNWDINENSVFIIHGWLQDVGDPLEPKKFKSAENIKNAFMETNRTENVIIMDWHLTSRQFYLNSAMDAHIVGETLGDFLVSLKLRGFLNYSQIYLVGFSLGAHIAGFAGFQIRNKANSKIGRITGLDPSGIKFDPIFDISKRLERTDAKFVDIIHCNAGDLLPFRHLGTMDKTGHVDFFPNGGQDQPTCRAKDNIALHQCSHLTCPQLYASSVRGKKYYGCKCESLKQYENGECNVCDGPLMGYSCPPTSRGIYYLKASPEKRDSPYDVFWKKSLGEK